MAVAELKKVIDIIPQLLDIPYKNMWYTYDEKVDVLYLNFKNQATQTTVCLPTTI
ncbi:MAG: hypothetical protein R6U35_04205 [Candidatus Humimicrobiaceae bacterium]